MNKSNTETLKENLQTAAEKTTEMAKTFAENSVKQFEATLNAGKAIFDTITKQFVNKHTGGAGSHAEFMNDGLDNSLKATTQWFKESTKTMTDLYEKQLRFILNSYSDFVESANDLMSRPKGAGFGSGTFNSSVDLFMKNIEESSQITKRMFASIIDHLSAETDKGFIKEVADLMQHTYASQTEQLIKFNKAMLSAENLQQTISLNKEVSAKLQSDLEKNFEASKKIIKSIFDSYTKEAAFSGESGKKMLDEIFAELDVVTSNNMKFWNKWFNEVYNNLKNAPKTDTKSKAKKSA